MLIRYSTETGGIEVKGTQSDFFNIASGMLRGEGEIRADNTGSTEPYGKFLASIAIRRVPDQPVSLTVAGNGDLVISGDSRGLEILARNLKEFAEAATRAEHLHVEYFPDHFYLAANSAPTVFALV